MNEAPRPSKRDEPITDSPWFWAYIFATAALIALAVAAPKYYPRQTQLERQYLARQEGGQAVKGSAGSIDPPHEQNLILSLGPLFLICASLLVVAWGSFWWSRSSPPPGEDTPHDTLAPEEAS